MKATLLQQPDFEPCQYPRSSFERLRNAMRRLAMLVFMLTVIGFGASVSAQATPPASLESGVIPVPIDGTRVKEIGFDFSLLYYHLVRTPSGESFYGEIRNDSEKGQPIPLISLEFVASDGSVLGTEPVQAWLSWADAGERIPLQSESLLSGAVLSDSWESINLIAEESFWSVEEVSTEGLQIDSVPVEGEIGERSSLKGLVVNVDSEPKEGPIYVQVAHYDQDGRFIGLCIGDDIPINLAPGKSGSFSVPLGQCGWVNDAIEHGVPRPEDTFYRLYLLVGP